MILLGLRVASRTAEQVENREKVTSRCTGTYADKNSVDPGFRKKEFVTEKLAKRGSIVASGRGCR